MFSLFSRCFGRKGSAKSSAISSASNSSEDLKGGAGGIAGLNGHATTAEKAATQITFDDYLTITSLVFEWGDSYDNKDWERLAKILSPTMLIDYSIVGHSRIDDMPAQDFIGMMSSPKFLGDPLVRTQHLMGAAKYERISATEIVGHHQIRAAHTRYVSLETKEVENKGHGHSYIKHWYRKVDGVWKLAGLCPKVYWNEFNFDKIFVQLSAEH